MSVRYWKRMASRRNPANTSYWTIDRNHLQDGQLNDNCCYFDVEILRLDDKEDVVEVRATADDGSYVIFEVLNDDTIVRFYR